MGAAGTLLVSEVIKILGGRLRPHFLAVCDPDYTQITCANGYILESHCQGTDTKKLIDARYRTMS